MDRAVKAPSGTHNNSDLLVWACYQCGGFDRWIEVEELYLNAFELALARLAWRTRGNLPDYKKCAKALQELEGPPIHSGGTTGLAASARPAITQ